MHTQKSLSDLLYIFHIELGNIFYLTHLLKNKNYFKVSKTAKHSNANFGIKFAHL